MAVKLRRADEFKTYLLGRLDEERRAVLARSLGADEADPAANAAALALVDVAIAYVKAQWDGFLAAPVRPVRRASIPTTDETLLPADGQE